MKSEEEEGLRQVTSELHLEPLGGLLEEEDEVSIASTIKHLLPRESEREKEREIETYPR